MIKKMEALLECSERLKTHLEDDALFKGDRDQFIEGIQTLLKERQACIDAFEWVKIKQPMPIVFSEEEKAVGQKNVAVDKEITRLLELRKKGHQEEWHQAYKKGKSSSKYKNPYQISTTNGAFYDQRK